MPERKDEYLLADMGMALKNIMAYADDLDYEDFLEDRKTQDAVVRNFEILGEAVKSISENFKKANPSIPWKNIAAVRDKLIHHYFGVNYEVVWGIITNNLPDVLAEVRKARKK